MDFCLKKTTQFHRNQCVCPAGSGATAWSQLCFGAADFSFRRLVLIWCVVVWNAILYIEYCDKRLQFKLKVMCELE